MGSHDLILKILDMLFGTWASAAFSTAGEGNISLLAELLSGVNVLAMLFAAIITGVFAFGGTVHAAVKGSFLGDGWSGAGTIISLLLALSMVMPVNLSVFSKDSNYQGQVSGAQLMVLKLAVYGSDVADALYKKTVLFFSSNGLSNSAHVGDVGLLIDLVEANLCTLAAIDNWKATGTVAKIKAKKNRHLTSNRPFQKLYAIKYGNGTYTKIDSYDDIDSFTKALKKINQSDTILVQSTDKNLPPLKVIVYPSQILFGGKDHICGIISLPYSQLDIIADQNDLNKGVVSKGEEIKISDTSKETKQASKTTKIIPKKPVKRDLAYIKKQIEANAYAQVRIMLASLVLDTYLDAENILATSLAYGGTSEEGAQYFTSKLNKANKDNIKTSEEHGLPLADDIYTSGVRFFTKLSNQKITMDKENQSLIQKLMLERGWLHAGVWGLEMSRLGAILPQLQTEILDLKLTNQSNNFCYYDSLLNTLKDWIGLKKTCEANIFMTSSWPTFKRFIISALTDGEVNRSIGAERFFLPSARLIKDNQCGIKGQESSNCATSTNASVSYTSNFLINKIWDDPYRYGIDNPREPISYISDTGQRMLFAGNMVSIVWAVVDAGINTLEGQSAGPLTAVFKFAASLLKPFAIIITTITISLYTFGYLLAYVLPILPVMHWIMGIFSWVITIVLAYIALPFALVLSIAPSGGGLLQKKQKIIQIAMAVFLTPALRLFGLFAALALAKISLALFNDIFWQALGLQSASNLEDSLFNFSLMQALSFFLISSSCIILVFRYSFMVMHTIPNAILKTLSLSGESFGDQYSEDPYSELSPTADKFSETMSGIDFSKEDNKDQKKKKGEEQS